MPKKSVWIQDWMYSEERGQVNFMQDFFKKSCFIGTHREADGQIKQSPSLIHYLPTYQHKEFHMPRVLTTVIAMEYTLVMYKHFNKYY